MAIPEATRPGSSPTSPAILHEEIDRLPERQRLPVVLCDLEGLTYEQAAGHLRWTVPTLRHRLAKARKRLRDRLTRRGVTAGAVGVVLAASTAGARAAVPAALARAAVAAATGGPTTAAAAALPGRPHQEHAHDQAEDRRGGRPGSGRARVGRRRRGRVRPARRSRAAMDSRRPAPR